MRLVVFLLTCFVALSSLKAATISVSPSSLQIWALVGGAKSVSFPLVRSTGAGTANLAVSTSTTDGGKWLSASLSSPTITAGGNSVSVTASVVDPKKALGGSSDGSVYTGQIAITATPGNIVVVTVTLNIYQGIDVTLSPAQLQFSVVPGQKLSQKVTATLSAGSLDQGFASISDIPSSPWLSAVNLPAGAGVSVNVDATGLDPGTHEASIKLQAPAIVGLIYVRAVVTGPTLISADQTSLSFPLSAGGAASQKAVNIVGTVDPAFFTPSVTAGANWLQAQSNSTATPAVLTVTAIPGSLAPGNYTGNIRITPSNGTAVSDIAVNMTLTATASTSLTASPASVSLSLSTGGACSSQQVAVSSASPLSGVSWSAAGTVASGPNWITVTPASGSTPGSLVVSCNGSGLGPGAYTGSVKIAAASVSTTFGVALTVSGLSMVSAATGDPRLSSGMIASVFGAGLSSATTIAASQVSTLSGVSVALHDSAGVSRACQLFFVSPGQINLAIPDATATGTATMAVNGPSGVVASTAVQIAAVAPGIFTMDFQPSGPAAALAFFYDAAGRLVSQPDAFRCTPAGVCTTFPLDVNGGPILVLSLYGTGFHRGTNFTARIGATSLTVLGVAPSPQFAGEDQMNILIPKSLAGAGDVALVITADGIASNTPHINLR
jgi:uncharacterized protein (TIGR03437 family)